MAWKWPWKGSSGAAVDLGQWKWDVHSHLVPGVDDGAATMKEALDMLRGMEALGYVGLVVTPHVMSDLYPNTPATLQPAFDAFQAEAKASGIQVELRLAAEYMMDSHLLELLRDGQILDFPCTSIPDGKSHRMVLMEFGFHQAPPRDLVKEAMFLAQTQGYTPLLAHCERYPYLHKDEDLLTLWQERGGWMSVNAASLAGAYGQETKEMAARCMKRGWVSFVCSDAHGMRHVKALETLATSRTLAKWVGSDAPQHLGLGAH